MTEGDVVRFVQKELHGNTNSVRHLMADLGWFRHEVKWDGVDHVRIIWIDPGCSVYRGELTLLDGTTEMIGDYLVRGDETDAFGMRL